MFYCNLLLKTSWSIFICHIVFVSYLYSIFSHGEIYKVSRPRLKILSDSMLGTREQNFLRLCRQAAGVGLSI